jgi:hypothetical protein
VLNTAAVPIAKTGERLLEQIDYLHDAEFRWSDLRRLLLEAEFAAGSGWESLKEKVRNLSPDDAAKITPVIDSVTRDLACAGTKEVFVVHLDDADVLSLAAELRPLTVTTNLYSQRFPLLLRAHELLGLTQAYELGAMIVRPNGDTSLALCARRTREERDRFDFSAVSTVVQHAFKGVDEFITITRTPYQICDIVTFRPGLKRLEVLIDHPSRIHNPESADERFSKVLQKLAPSMPTLAKFYESNAPANLFAAINGLYSDKREGRVTKLSCRLPTGPIVRQAMTTSDDLRDETFHAAGVAAVGTITPNWVSVVWDSLINVAGSVELSVGAPVHSLSSVGANVRSARLSNIRSDAGVVVAINKLMKYL